MRLVLCQVSLAILSSASRGQGLGHAPTRNFAPASGIEKTTPQMAVDQTDHVRDRDGRSRDIVLLGHDTAKFGARIAAHGSTERLERSRCVAVPRVRPRFFSSWGLACR